MQTLRRLSIMLVLLALAGTVAANSSQQPGVGTDQQVWDAIDVVWKIRGSKKWGDALDARELKSVELALDSIDDWMMNKREAFFTPQIFKHLFDGNIAQATRIRVVTSHEAYAGFDKVGKTIDISIGLLQAMYWTQWAVEEARENPVLRPHLANYLFALSRNNFQRTPVSASSVIRLTEFLTGKPWRPDNALTNKIEDRVTKANFDALVFIISHEGCHASLGHVVLTRQDAAIRQEWAADAW